MRDFRVRWAGFPVKLACLCIIMVAVALITVREYAAEVLLFEELFEDTNWASRGWYDDPKMKITPSEHIPGSGHSCVWHWTSTLDFR